MNPVALTPSERQPTRGIFERIRTYGSLVTLAHTVFAMPFAASAVVLAHAVPHAPLTVRRVAAMLVCMVAARSSAMAYNRYADRDVDRENPRTQSRHIPSGAVSPREALLLTAVAGAVFVGSAATLGTVPLLLAPLVLLVLLGYSHAKRFTWASHAWLGLALALAPGARGSPWGPRRRCRSSSSWERSSRGSSGSTSSIRSRTKPSTARERSTRCPHGSGPGKPSGS